MKAFSSTTVINVCFISATAAEYLLRVYFYNQLNFVGPIAKLNGIHVFE